MHVIFVVRVRNVMLLSSSASSSASACYYRRQRAKMHVILVVGVNLMDAIVVGHRKRHHRIIQSSCRSISIIMMMTTTLVIGASTSSIIARSGRAPRPPRRDRVRDVAAARRAANVHDDNICPAGVNGSFFRVPSLSRYMHLSTRSSSRGKRLLLLAHPSIITASAVARPLSSSSEHHQIV